MALATDPKPHSPEAEATSDPANADIQAGSPPTPGTSAQSVISFLVVAGAVIFTVLQLQPSLLTANTTPTGGDMGAHVWAPDFVRRVLLGQGRLMGWAPDWYAGFPALTFYFPLPTLMIVALDLVLPYGIAFKLVTVSGILTLPVAAWALGRLARMPFPGPPLLAAASVVFLFDTGFTIYGGNIASTLAGEFSFSISLSLALVFLGVVMSGLDTRRKQALAAGLLALTGLSHLLPTLFAVTGAGAWFLVQPSARRLRATLSILSVGALLAAFWSLPFLFRLPYANDMGWEKLIDYRAQLMPDRLRWWVAAALLGAALSIYRNRQLGMFLVLMAGVGGLVFRFAPQGRLWNARALPFWFLCIYLLVAVAIAELGPALVRGLSRDVDRPGRFGLIATPVAGAMAVFLFVGLPLGVIPSWVPVAKASQSSFVPGWAKWNYSGYEAKDAYPEYRDVISLMTTVGKDRGCGRTHWEYESEQNRFGTPMALMLLPYWTQGCIASMEGLYFESSATTPFHFLNAGELSTNPSNPQRDLPYTAERPDLESGVAHMQLLGVRYYLAFSPEAVAAADIHPDLTNVASSGKWNVYEVAGSELVAPLEYEPTVMTGVAKGGKEWLGVAAAWYTRPDNSDRFLAAGGPPSWKRVEVASDPEPGAVVGSDVVIPSVPRRSLPEVEVSNIKQDRRGLTSFSVDKMGVPVLVKTSYFPNWRARGAEGPWRVAPNLMVVVPTSRDVTLRYAWTPAELLGWLATAAGIAAVFLWVRNRSVWPVLAAAAARIPKNASGRPNRRGTDSADPDLNSNDRAQAVRDEAVRDQAVPVEAEGDGNVVASPDPLVPASGHGPVSAHVESPPADTLATEELVTPNRPRPPRTGATQPDSL